MEARRDEVIVRYEDKASLSVIVSALEEVLLEMSSKVERSRRLRVMLGLTKGTLLMSSRV